MVYGSLFVTLCVLNKFKSYALQGNGYVCAFSVDMLRGKCGDAFSPATANFDNDRFPI